jgi:class 3 adenylate cyclase
VEFETDAARERARTRLLQAARKYRIVPVGFIANEIEVAQRAKTAVELPSGFVTMLMTDIEGSSALLHHLGDAYGGLLEEVCKSLRRAVADVGGHEVEARADEFFAVFEDPRAAVDAAVAAQRDLALRVWDGGVDVRVRVGIHSGYPTSRAANYIGMDVHTTARICAAGHGGQIVVSANTRDGCGGSTSTDVRFRTLGTHRLRGIPAEVELFQVAAKGLSPRFPALRTDGARRQKR